jgi:hypothetical protein
MKKIPQPQDVTGQSLDPTAVFEACIEGCRDAPLLVKLRAISANIASESSAYHNAATALSFQLNTIPRKVLHGGVTEQEMVSVYTAGMVKRINGRKIYDKIKLQAPDGKCPFCGIGVVSTLDHYLPKGQYPIFSVTPNNLVPACKDCQGSKLEFYPSSENKQILHPYYDDMDSDIWLMATVVETSPAAFQFDARPPATWTAVNNDRVKEHLKKLQLPKLFASNAGSLLGEIRGRLENLHSKGGKDEVRRYLKEELRSFEQKQKNSWKTAMYRAAIASDWFCDGGFK